MVGTSVVGTSPTAADLRNSTREMSFRYFYHLLIMIVIFSSVSFCFIWHIDYICSSFGSPNTYRLIFLNTVPAVSKCIEHDETWNATEECWSENRCGTCRCDTGTQCWVQWVSVKTAHFGARMLKRRPKNVFSCLLIAPEGLGSESRWKWWARGTGVPHENFSQFHPCLPPQKAKFQSYLAWPLSRWPPIISFAHAFITLQQ